MGLCGGILVSMKTSSTSSHYYPPVPPSSPWEQEHRRGIEKEMGDVSAPHWYPDLQHWQTQGSRAGVVLLTVF